MLNVFCFFVFHRHGKLNPVRTRGLHKSSRKTPDMVNDLAQLENLTQVKYLYSTKCTVLQNWWWNPEPISDSEERVQKSLYTKERDLGEDQSFISFKIVFILFFPFFDFRTLLCSICTVDSWRDRSILSLETSWSLWIHMLSSPFMIKVYVLNMLLNMLLSLNADYYCHQSGDQKSCSSNLLSNLFNNYPVSYPRGSTC